MGSTSAIILVTPLLLALAVGSVVSLEAVSRMDCGCLKQWTLVELKADENSPCNLVAKRSDSDDFLETLDLVHACTCQLANKEVVWQSFLNEGIQNIIIGFMHRYHLKPTSTASEWLFYIKTSFFGRAKTYKIETLKAALSNQYDIPLTARTDIEPNFTEKVQKLETSCARHVARFAHFHEIFMKMSTAVCNERLIEEIGSHSPSLFKNIIAYYLCDTTYNSAS